MFNNPFDDFNEEEIPLRSLRSLAEWRGTHAKGRRFRCARSARLRNGEGRTKGKEVPLLTSFACGMEANILIGEEGQGGGGCNEV